MNDQIIQVQRRIYPMGGHQNLTLVLVGRSLVWLSTEQLTEIDVDTQS